MESCLMKRINWHFRQKCHFCPLLHCTCKLLGHLPHLLGSILLPVLLATVSQDSGGATDFTNSNWSSVRHLRTWGGTHLLAWATCWCHHKSTWPWKVCHECETHDGICKFMQCFMWSPSVSNSMPTRLEILLWIQINFFAEAHKFWLTNALGNTDEALFGLITHQIPSFYLKGE